MSLASVAIIIGLERIALNNLQNVAGALLIGYFGALAMFQYVVYDVALTVITRHVPHFVMMRKYNVYKAPGEATRLRYRISKAV